MSFVLTVLALMVSPEPTIVVTARRETEKALADCLARQCGVREDAIASTLQAQVQFAEGDYRSARKTLWSALHRNSGATEQDPRALSALWHALARVTLHNGDMQEYRRAALRSGTILANATSITPQERQMGQVQVGDALAASGDPEGAVRRYRRVGALASQQGDIELAQLMTLRAIYVRSGSHGRPAARSAFERQAKDTTLTPRARTIAMALAAQLQDSQASLRVNTLDKVPLQAADAPTLLLWSPKDKLSEQSEAVTRALENNDPLLQRALMPRSSEAKSYRWVDVGFWVRPNGRVEEARMLRGRTEQSWSHDIVELIQSRRYAPYEAELGSEGRYKIERVTLTYEHMKPGGSLIRRRSGLPSYQFEDLKTEENNTVR